MRKLAGLAADAFHCFFRSYPVWLAAMDKNAQDNLLPTAPDFLQTLIQLALNSGADDARLLPAQGLVIREELAQLCGPDKPCPSYGLSPDCPPHAMQPSAFRLLAARCNWMLVFKINAAMEILLGPERQDIARQVHHICAVIEDAAMKQLGLVAHGFAAGSCKELFCTDAKACIVLAHGEPCPSAQVARPSLSAVGVDFQALARLAGWPYALNGVPDAHSGTMQGLMAGFVLLENSSDREMSIRGGR